MSLGRLVCTWKQSVTIKYSMYGAKEDRVKTDNIGKGNKSKELEKENDIKEVSLKIVIK